LYESAEIALTSEIERKARRLRLAERLLVPLAKTRLTASGDELHG